MKAILQKAALATFALVALAGSQVFASTTAPKAKLGGRFAREYAMLASPEWRSSFPQLSRYEVIGHATGGSGTKGGYNCIAHTIGVHDRWVWPGAAVADFDRLYGSSGYRRMAKLDYGVSASYNKIVLYGKVYSGGRIECTHGALQSTNGTWTSKLGAGPLIRHTRPEMVGGPSYGRPIFVYVRNRRGPSGPSRPSTPSRPTRPRIAEGPGGTSGSVPVTSELPAPTPVAGPSAPVVYPSAVIDVR